MVDRLPDEVAVRCLAVLPFVDACAAARVNKRWNALRKSQGFRTARAETDERALVFAGYLDDGPNRGDFAEPRNDCFALTNGRWYRLASVPGAFIGGFMTVGEELWNLRNNVADQSRAYCLKTNSWRTIEGLGEANWVTRQFSDGQFIVTMSSHDRLESHQLGGTGWLEIPVPPLGFSYDYSSMCCVDGIFYVVVGDTSAFDDVFDALQAYDLATRTWSILPSMPHARSEALLVALDGQVFVVGGYEYDEDEDRLRTIISFDPAEQTWRDDYPEIPIFERDLPMPRGTWGFGMAAVAHEGKLAVFGLRNSPNLIMENGAWKPLPDIFPPESDQRAIFPSLASLRLE